MLSKEFRAALNVLHDALRKTGISWTVIGSTNMCLQGMDVTPHDLDIVVSLSDLRKLPGIFSKCQPSPIRKLDPLGDDERWEVKFHIGDVEIQAIGEKDSGGYLRRIAAGRIVKLPLDRIVLQCFMLDAEAMAYEEMKRESKSRMIRDFLNMQNR